MGDNHRTTFVLNPSIRQLSSHSANLATSYCIKAVHLKGVKAESVLYAPTEDSRVQSHVFPPSTVNQSHVPVAYTRVGGWFSGIRWRCKRRRGNDECYSKTKHQIAKDNGETVVLLYIYQNGLNGIRSPPTLSLLMGLLVSNILISFRKNR